MEERRRITNFLDENTADEDCGKWQREYSIVLAAVNLRVECQRS
jgi:hypothetical protein